MTDKEYQDKKRECWEEFKRTNLDGEVQWQPVNRYDVFCAAFDRAYALGREKETITQEEIEKAAEEYSKHLGKSRNVTWNDAEYGFIAGANFALGKHEKDAEDDGTLKVNRQLFCRLCADADDYINEHLEEEDSDYTYYQGRSDALHELYRGEYKDAEDTVIHGWIARDLNGDVFLYENNPERGWDEWVGRISSEFDFKKLRWNSDPIEVELIIKRKKNG